MIERILEDASEHDFSLLVGFVKWYQRGLYGAIIRVRTFTSEIVDSPSIEVNVEVRGFSSMQISKSHDIRLIRFLIKRFVGTYKLRQNFTGKYDRGTNFHAGLSSILFYLKYKS